jgi:hypothetical protein
MSEVHIAHIFQKFICNNIYLSKFDKFLKVSTV